MQIQLFNNKWLIISAATVLIVYQAVSFNVFAFLLTLSYLFWALVILLFVIFGILYLYQRKANKLEVCIGTYMLLLLLFTIVSATNIKMCAYDLVSNLLLVLLFNYAKNNIKILFTVIATTLSVVIYANLLLMILFPNWMFATKSVGDCYLLGGNYNAMGCRFICAMASVVMTLKIHKLWLLNAIPLFIVCIGTALAVGSMTTVGNLLLFTLMCLIPTLGLKKIALISLLIAFVLFEVTVCVNGEGLHNNETAMWLIQDVMGKDVTFTGRTHMWASALEQIKKSPLIGYGYVDKDWYMANMTTFAIGPHNYIFWVLLSGGVTLLGLYITQIILVFRRAISKFDTMSCILLMAVTTIFLMMTMEVYPMFFVVLLFMLSYYYPEFKEQCRKNYIEK